MAEMNDSFNEVTAEMLKVISDYDSVTGFQGAYNIRQDSMCAGRKNSENITIESKTDKPGINIRVKPGTKGETVYIPACVTHSNVDDLVYNDFFIGEGADVTIVAGCGVHSDGSETARHNGIHRFFLEKGAKVLYKEKHIGTGKGTGKRHPTLRDHVLVGAGAKVLGPFKIGDNARIASNAVVLSEVPPDATAVGIPAQIVRIAGKTTHYADEVDQTSVENPTLEKLEALSQRVEFLEKLMDERFMEEKS